MRTLAGEYMRLTLPKVWLLVGLLFPAGLALASQDPTKASAPYSDESRAVEASSPERPRKENGMIMLDYQTLPIKGYQSIDLLGFQFYKQFTNWLYVGVGGYAPLVRGDYGGFMVFDVSVHAQQKLFGNLFADVGASLGGGGGGNSVEQSKLISGAGGFQKAYVGLGYDFGDYSLGMNISKIRFTGSAINSSQLDFFVQFPFSYYVGSYANAGGSFPSTQDSGRLTNPDKTAANIVEIGLDNIIQIRPQGSYKGTVNLADVQFDHFVTDRTYLLFDVGIGYRGLPIYNQVFGGIGYNYPYSPRVNFRGQLALGSGGYAPEKIDTGPGLLVYPKLSAEYMLGSSLGISLSGGYLYAPKGTSRNLTVGAMLNYHDSREDWSHLDGNTAADIRYSGYRVSIFEQSELNATVERNSQGTLQLLSVQIDTMVSKNFYVPAQISVAYNQYLGYPGYGELLAGVGAQNEYLPGDRFQSFAQMLVGANVNGIIAKPGVGLNFGLSDKLAIYGQIGATISLINTTQHANHQFRSPYVGLGLTYRFSVPHR